jgi:4-nitrophenyl phosphatase
MHAARIFLSDGKEEIHLGRTPNVEAHPVTVPKRDIPQAEAAVSRTTLHTQIMHRYSLYILDLDGTLFRGNEALPGAVETVAELQKQGALVRYLTNNSGMTRHSYQDKLASMGFAVKLDDIYSSAIGTAAYCAEAKLRNLFVVGESGLIETLQAANLTVINFDGTGPDQADAVVAGIHKKFSYAVMAGAMQQVIGGARLIATNTDATYPIEGGGMVPGAGAIVASLERCTGQDAFVVGKPNPYLIELVMKDAGVAPSDTLVVGDRYETDIESGIRAGCDTHLVLTGVSKRAPEGQSFSADLTGLLIR